MYFKLFFEYANERLKEFSHGAVLVNISSIKSLKKFPISFPPSYEQQEIAHILNTINKKNELEKGRKSLFKEIFKSMLHKLMTGEIR